MISKFVNKLPKGTREKLKGTKIAEAYSHYQYYHKNYIRSNYRKARVLVDYHINTSYILPKTFETSFGTMSIYIPKHAFSWYSKEHEPTLNEELSNALGRDTVFYDIGSQFGYHIEFALREGVPPNDIHAFEMKKHRYRYILQPEFGSEGVNVNNTLVGNQSVNGSTSIDEYSTGKDSPDVIKIDVEGAEGNVVEGMKNTLQNDSPTVFVEMHPNMIESFGYQLETIYDIFDQYGYHTEITDHNDIESEWYSLDTNENIKNKTYLLKATT